MVKKNIRKLLDEIIHTDGGDNWWKPELFNEKTLAKLSKELEILAIPPSSEENYNCFIYALGFAGDKKFIAEHHGFIYDTFFQKLIKEKLLEYINKPEKGDYILYQDLKNYPNMITHIGVICNDDMIISKWAWGPTIKHKLFDVPKSYGDDVSYIKAISKEKATEYCMKYNEFNIKPD